MRRFVDLDVESLAISPSGRRLVFSRQRSVSDSTQHLYSVRASGRGLRRVTTSSGAATDPQFSPSGKRIVFTKERQAPQAGSPRSGSPEARAT